MVHPPPAPGSWRGCCCAHVGWDLRNIAAWDSLFSSIFFFISYDFGDFGDFDDFFHGILHDVPLLFGDKGTNGEPI